MNSRVIGLALGAVTVLVAERGHDAASEAAVEPRASVPQEVPQVTLVPAEEPVLVVGGRAADGPEAYEFHRIDGAVRTADGGIIVGVRGSYEVRRFGPDGTHLWSSGRKGDGPGDFRAVSLLGGCTTARSVFVYDYQQRRITVLDGDGGLVRTFPLTLPSYRPARTVRCAPGGRFVMADWGNETNTEKDRFVAGPHRLSVSLIYQDEEGARARILREDIPGQDRVTYVEEGLEPISGPRRWGRSVVYAPTDKGVWMGTGDDYEIEFVGWNGKVRRRLDWTGPELAVTQADLDAYRASLRERYAGRGESGWRAEYEDRWNRESANLPSIFPSLSAILTTSAGGLWAERYARPGESERAWYFFEDGRWTKTLYLPKSRYVLDAGTDWVLVRITDSLGVQRLAVYELVEGPGPTRNETPDRSHDAPAPRIARWGGGGENIRWTPGKGQFRVGCYSSGRLHAASPHLSQASRGGGEDSALDIIFQERRKGRMLAFAGQATKGTRTLN